MTATKELRRMLDERSIEWGNIRNDGSESDYLTEWQFKDNRGKVVAIEWAVGSGLSIEIHHYHLTPAQVIEATLGRKGCRLIRHGSLADWPEMVCWSCSECNFGWHHSVYDKQFTYCPNCGRKVIY